MLLGYSCSCECHQHFWWCGKGSRSNRVCCWSRMCCWQCVFTKVVECRMISVWSPFVAVAASVMPALWRWFVVLPGMLLPSFTVVRLTFALELSSVDWFPWLVLPAIVICALSHAKLSLLAWLFVCACSCCLLVESHIFICLLAVGVRAVFVGLLIVGIIGCFCHSSKQLWQGFAQ